MSFQQLHPVTLIPYISVEDWLSAMAPPRRRQTRATAVNDAPRAESQPTPSSPSAALTGASAVVSHISLTESVLSSPPPSLAETDIATNPDNNPDAWFNYDGIDWSQVLGYTKLKKKPERALTSAMWTAGWPLERGGARHYLCRECHQTSALNNHIYNIAGGSSNVTKHLRFTHELIVDPMDSSRLIHINDAPSLQLDLDANDPRDQALLNQLADAFDEDEFHRLVMRWMVYENISLRQIESEPFREMVAYLSQRGYEALTCAATLRKLIMRSYQQWKQKVKQELRLALSKIHISFDLWTSGNCLALNGIVAHFIDRNSKPKTILLATPEQSEAHTGLNISDEVIKVIEDFGIQEMIGWFVIDNVSNNDTALDDIAEKLGFDALERRLRCAGHIINLIARHLLYGFDEYVFEKDSSIPSNLKDQLARWRRFGPIGKAHNLIVWIYASPQRRARWHKCK